MNGFDDATSCTIAGRGSNNRPFVVRGGLVLWVAGLFAVWVDGTALLVDELGQLVDLDVGERPVHGAHLRHLWHLRHGRHGWERWKRGNVPVFTCHVFLQIHFTASVVEEQRQEEQHDQEEGGEDDDDAFDFDLVLQHVGLCLLRPAGLGRTEVGLVDLVVGQQVG